MKLTHDELISWAAKSAENIREIQPSNAAAFDQVVEALQVLAKSMSSIDLDQVPLSRIVDALERRCDVVLLCLALNGEHAPKDAAVRTFQRIKKGNNLVALGMLTLFHDDTTEAVRRACGGETVHTPEVKAARGAE